MSRQGKRRSGEGWGLVERCPVCGRDKEACVCPPRPAQSLPYEKQRPRYRMEKRRGKPVTVITHLQLSEADLKGLSSTLKARLGVGGTVNGSEIELQGDHRETLPAILSAMGFKA